MSDQKGPPRTETDASLHVERQNTDRELGRRVAVADADADQVLRLARDRADRLLEAARAASDAGLPLSEQTRIAAELLLEREQEDQTIRAARAQDDTRLNRERTEQRARLFALLVLERQATDLHLALERRSADQAVSTREDFLAQASHDLRGLMAAHKLYVALLVKGASAAECGHQLAPQIRALAQIDAQMDRMIADLVDIVAIEAGKLGVELAPRSAMELLSTATAVFAPLAAERGQSFTVVPAPEDVVVHVDVVRAIQVLGNLLSNAIKFTPEAGAIRVGFEAAVEEVTFFVADTGPGVPAEEADRIFERFAGSGRAPGGLGLGLFISERLVDAHGGRLWLDDARTQGAVFRFTLPRATCVATADPVRARTARAKEGRRKRPR